MLNKINVKVMKFVEYYALREQLEKEGSTINEFMNLSEKGEDDTEKLDTKGDTLKQITSPKFALARKKITNNAKKMKKMAEEKIIKKWMPSQMKTVKELANKMAVYLKDGKSPQEILGSMGEELQNMKTTQAKAVKNLDSAIDKLKLSFEKRVEQIIEKADLKDKSKLKLEIYWNLVSTQVSQMIFKQVNAQRAQIIEEMATNNKEIGQMMKKLIEKDNISSQIEQYGKQVEEEKKKFKNADSKEEKIEFKVGEVYQYTNNQGESTNLEISKVEDDKVIGKTKANPKGFVINKDKVGKKIKDAEEKPEETPAK